MKAEKSKWFHCKTLRFLFSLVQVFKEVTKKFLQICLTTWKNNYCHSIFQLPIVWNHDWLSIQSQQKATSKLGRNINKSIFSDKTFQSNSFGWKKDLLKFFWMRYCTLAMASFFFLKHLPKTCPHVKVKSRSKVMPVLVFYLWRHLWQTFQTVANLLHNSCLSRNTRFLLFEHTKIIKSF